MKFYMKSTFIYLQTTEQKPREAILCHEFFRAVEYLNKSLPKEDQIVFRQWDLHKFAHW